MNNTINFLNPHNSFSKKIKLTGKNISKIFWWFAKRISLIFALILIVVIVFLIGIFLPKQVINNSVRTGIYLGDEVWSGDINITGDTTIIGDLFILPGTNIKFNVSDDKASGGLSNNPLSDINDPTKTEGYSKTHSSLTVLKRIVAAGTDDKKITFTSNANVKNFADFESITYWGDGSTFDNIIVEYSRSGLVPQGDQPNSIIKNSIFRNNFWSGLSLNESTVNVENNLIQNCGLTCIQITGGKSDIENNKIEDCNVGIDVKGGVPIIKDNTIIKCKSGIMVGKGLLPHLDNNTVIVNKGPSLIWKYNNFIYN